jgi:aldehyde dehydrogenase (NAD+)
MTKLTQPFGGIGMSGTGYYRGKYGFLRFCHLRSITETPTWGFIEKMMTGRYPPYTEEKAKKMEKLTGKPNPPFTRVEGSADRPQGLSGWIYAGGVAVVAGLAGAWYRSNQRQRL